MSEGTRDQLYLALRLPAVELHLEKAKALPLEARRRFLLGRTGPAGSPPSRTCRRKLASASKSLRPPSRSCGGRSARSSRKCSAKVWKFLCARARLRCSRPRRGGTAGPVLGKASARRRCRCGGLTPAPSRACSRKFRWRRRPSFGCPSIRRRSFTGRAAAIGSGRRHRQAGNSPHASPRTCVSVRELVLWAPTR